MTEQGINGVTSSDRPNYTRVLLKLGGEMFGGGQVGLDPDVVALVARQIAEVVRTGVQVAGIDARILAQLAVVENTIGGDAARARRTGRGFRVVITQH